MLYDKTALDAECAAIPMVLDADVKSFESGFGTVHIMRYEPLSVKYIPASEAAIKLDGYEIKGFGDTSQEAVDDWRVNLKKVPSKGAILCWRVFPECAWTRNFDTEKVKWMVYARIAIHPQIEAVEG